MEDSTKLMIEKIKELAYTGSIAGVGGFANYLWYLSKGKPFKFTMFLINIALGFFCGNVIGCFIPTDFEYRDGILMIAGFAVWNLLAFFESYGVKIVTSAAKSPLGLLKEENKNSKL